LLPSDSASDRLVFKSKYQDKKLSVPFLLQHRQTLTKCYKLTLNDVENSIGSFICSSFTLGLCDGAVGWCTALQGRGSWFRFPVGSLDFSLTSCFRSHYGPAIDSEMGSMNTSRGVRQPVPRADSFDTFMCRLFRTPGRLNFLEP